MKRIAKTLLAVTIFFAAAYSAQAQIDQNNTAGNSADIFSINNDESTRDAALRLQAKSGSNHRHWVLWNDKDDRKLRFGFWSSNSFNNSSNKTAAGTIRMTLTHDGKLGVGTESPSEKLHVAGRIYLGEGNGTAGAWYQAKGGNGEAWFAGIGDQSNNFRIYNNGDRFSISTDGNVGIGTNNASQKLHVVGNSMFDGPIITGGKNTTLRASVEGSEGLIMPGNDSQFVISVQDGNGRVQQKWNASHTTGETFLVGGEDAAFIDMTADVNSDAEAWFELKHADGAGKSAGAAIAWNTHFSITQGGNVGVGTHAPTHKLHVTGTLKTTDAITTTAINASGDITARRVTVQVNTFPDYVFAPSYELMPLADVEAYINAHSHLPNMPTEAEVVEGGMDLGQLNILLTEKVEELTLYTIEQEKRLKAMEAQLAKQQALIEQLLSND